MHLVARQSDFIHFTGAFMGKIISTVHAFYADEDGVTALEYGMLAAAIAAVTATTVMAIGPFVKSAFTSLLVALGGTAIP
jgi:pilus assembly protein Flp/PilA